MTGLCRYQAQRTARLGKSDCAGRRIAYCIYNEEGFAAHGIILLPDNPWLRGAEHRVPARLVRSSYTDFAYASTWPLEPFVLANLPSSQPMGKEKKSFPEF